MRDERVQRVLVGLFFWIGMGLSGCNGCSGCEGQTTVEAPPPAASEEQTLKIPQVAPSAQVAPTTNVEVAPSAAPNPEHDPTGMRRCCKAISDNLASAPDKHKATWKSALEACNEAVEKQTGRKGLAAAREILTPVGWPAACQ